MILKQTHGHETSMHGYQVVKKTGEVYAWVNYHDLRTSWNEISNSDVPSDVAAGESAWFIGISNLQGHR